MAGSKDSGLREDAIISRLKPAPGQAPVGLTSYIGLLGRSPREGYWLLYSTLDMSQWMEINESDIVHSEQLPPDRSPFGSLGGTQVFVKQNASLTTSKTVSQTHAASEPPDEFDLDVRLGGGSASPAIPGTKIGGGPGGTCETCLTQCSETKCQGGGTCATCATCQTQCNQATCIATCATCQTNCNQATCHTCQTNCNQATCHTCRTQCNQPTCNATCITCHTCDTCLPPTRCM
jgi:hypothetical protein